MTTSHTTTRPQIGGDRPLPHTGHLGQPGEVAPAAVNSRRPHLVLAEVVDEPMMRGASSDRPTLERSGIDEGQIPLTAMRLPDLSLLAKNFSSIRWNRRLASEVAQWSGLCLGGLLALWLIFGNRGGAMAAPEDTPAWTAPDHAKAAPKAAAWTPPAPDAPEAPRWDAPQHTATPGSTAPNPTTAPVELNQTAPPAQQPPSGPQLPAMENPAHQAMVPGTSGLRMAQREVHNDPPAAGNSPAGEAQPLGITVPVPQ